MRISFLPIDLLTSKAEDASKVELVLSGNCWDKQSEGEESKLILKFPITETN